MSETVTNEHGGKQSHIAAAFDSIPPNALKLVAECFAFGRDKYGDTNWHKITVREHLAHSLNHVNEYRRGDIGEMHLVNNAVRSLMALERAVMDHDHDTDYWHPDMEANCAEAKDASTAARDARAVA